MSDQDGDDKSSILARTLGQELQLIRENRGWSRAEMVSQLSFDISRRTLNSYELGDSHYSVSRFVEMCQTLLVYAPDILGIALQRAEFELGHVYVDVQQVLRASHEGIRRWAENRYSGDPGAKIIRLRPDTIHEMAALCGMPHSALTEYLAQFAPEAATFASRRSDRENVPVSDTGSGAKRVAHPGDL